MDQRNVPPPSTVITHLNPPGMAIGQPGVATQPSAVTPIQAPDTFPYKSNLVTGSLQVILGLLAIILQVVDMILVSNLKADFISVLKSRAAPTQSSIWDDFGYSFSWNHIRVDGQYYEVSYREKNYFDSFGVAYAGIGIWTGIPFVITGIVGILLSREKKNLNQRMTLKNAYIILSIIMACGFAPTLGIGEMVALGEWSSYDVTRGICPWLLLAVAFAEFTTSIVGASYGCCCSSIGTGVVANSTVTVTNYAYPQTTVLSQPVNHIGYMGAGGYPPTHLPPTQMQVPPPYTTTQNTYEGLRY